jgi:FKBP-type peptidyl-prolyl cis-trans isomerase (trigger factor)
MPTSPVVPRDNAHLNELIEACRGYVTIDDVAKWVPFKPNEEFAQWLKRAELELKRLATEFVSQVEYRRNKKSPHPI